jgi:hypothetical protein
MEYVHGHRRRERRRLRDQADALVELLHGDTHYPTGSRVLEVGCGVGAQTVTLATRSPGAAFVSVDLSDVALHAARRAARRAGLSNVEFRQADAYTLPFPPASFDHVFVCFVLEHLSRPARALAQIHEVLKPGGTLTVIEGDHGSACFHPDAAAARAVIQCLVSLQASAGGDANVGRRLYPLLTGAEFERVRVSPRMVYVDGSQPGLSGSFTTSTFIAMIAGVRQAVLAAGLCTARQFNAGLRGLRRTTEADGVFCYTFFKGVGRRATPVRRQVARPGASATGCPAGPSDRDPRAGSAGLPHARPPARGW